MPTTPTQRRSGWTLQYSLSDRIRYYWNVPEVRAACEALVADLRGRGIPLTLLSQYLPPSTPRSATAGSPTTRTRCLLDGVRTVLGAYARACGSGAHG